MTRAVPLLLVLVGCGGPSPAHDASISDANASDAYDASDASDAASPDANLCTDPTDTDGDGACDAVDLCPDIPDPGQPDLDGDHIGWMCDPVETVVLPGDGTPPSVVTSIHDDTFAARTTILCPSFSSPPCGHALVQVGPAGAVITRSDSLVAADAWQATATAPWFDGPLVTANNRVLWSRGFQGGEIGDFDIAAGVFTPRATGAFHAVYSTADAIFGGRDLLAVPLQLAGSARSAVGASSPSAGTRRTRSPWTSSRSTAAFS